VKLKNLFLIGTISLICSLASFSQTTCLPDSVLKKVVDELIVKDHLQFTVKVQDSILNVLKHSNTVQLEKINIYVLKEQEYKSIVFSLEQRIEIKEAQITDAKKEGKRGKIKSFFVGSGVGAIILTILILL